MKTDYTLKQKLALFAGALAVALPLSLFGHDHGRALDPVLSSVDDLRLKGSFGAEWGYSYGGKNRGVAQSSERYQSFNISHIRLGVEGALFDDFEFDTVLSIMPNGNLVHDLGGLDAGVRLYRATLTYTAFDPVNLTVGHDRPLFGIEGSTADEDLNTITRSVLTGQVRPNPHTGLSAHGDWEFLTYHAGIYNSDAEGGANDPGVHSSNYLFNASLGANLDDIVDAAHPELTASVRVDYIYQDESSAGHANAGQRYDFKDATAAGASIGFMGINLAGEYIWARSLQGMVRPRIEGFNIKPSFFVADDIELVARYERLRNTEGGAVGGMLAHNVYADSVQGIAADGNKYQAAYIGANYYMVDGHVKLMAGVEWAELRNDRAGGFNSQATTGIGAVRVNF